MLLLTLLVLSGALLMVLAVLLSHTLFFDLIFGVSQKIIFGNQSMIYAMCCISLLGSVVWGHYMYTVGLETDTRAYFTGVTILISLPTGTKIFNWLSSYLGNPNLLQLRTSSALFALLFLLMFTSGGSI